MEPRATSETRYASRFAALGNPARLRVVRLLLSAHPGGLTVGELREALDMPAPTLTHHLDCLRRERLVAVRREGRFLRHTVDCETLEGLLRFLFAECCTRNRVVDPDGVTTCGTKRK